MVQSIRVHNGDDDICADDCRWVMEYDCLCDTDDDDDDDYDKCIDC